MENEINEKKESNVEIEAWDETDECLVQSERAIFKPIGRFCNGVAMHRRKNSFHKYGGVFSIFAFVLMLRA